MRAPDCTNRERWSTGWCIISRRSRRWAAKCGRASCTGWIRTPAACSWWPATDAAHRALAAQFAGRTVEKIYLALVHGKVRADSGRDHQADRPRSRPAHPHDGAAGVGTRGADRIPRAAAIREVHVSGSADRHGSHASDPGASGEHRASGGRRSSCMGRRPHERIFLHAWRIGFVSPATGERVTVEAPLPAELANWLAGL